MIDKACASINSLYISDKKIQKLSEEYRDNLIKLKVDHLYFTKFDTIVSANLKTLK